MRLQLFVIVDEKKDLKMQLIGAVGLLFLLGTPWIFSAFGALTVTNSNSQLTLVDGIFQVSV